MRWTVQGLAGGPRRVNHASVAVGKVIYSFGGKTRFKIKDLRIHPEGVVSSGSKQGLCWYDCNVCFSTYAF